MDQVFTQGFWEKIYDKFIGWAIAEIPSLLIITVVIVVSIWAFNFTISRFKKLLIKRAHAHDKPSGSESEKRINTLTGILKGLVKIVLLTVYMMIVLKKLGIDIGPILASAGIIGLAVGFGAQELVRDIISGFFILLENQVRTGDVAIINGTGGLVENIELRTITLRDFTGTIHIFQNGKISTLSNMTKEWSAAVFDIGVAYKEDVTRVMEIMRQVGDEMQKDEEFGAKILEPIEVLGLDKFGDSAIVIKARFKTKPIMQWGVSREYNKRLKSAFDKEGIEIPFPHTTIYWGEEISPLKLETQENNLQKNK